MYHSLLMFLALETPAAQATPVSPPAQERAGQRGSGLQVPGLHVLKLRLTSIRFMAGVAGNAIGFGALLAGCWFSLQLMQVILPAA